MKPLLAPGLALLLAAQAEAAGNDYLKLVYEGGVFQGVKDLPADRLMKGERGYLLTPNAYGGEWSVVLGSAAANTLTSKVHLSFAGNVKALDTGAPTIGKLMARLSVTAARSCFSMGTERLSALKSWVEESVKTGAGSDLNTERSFGPLRLQLLTKRTVELAANGLAEVDVLLSRSGTPGAGGWTQVCGRG
ncbi:hypothetical protein [Deinococcus sp.]|uniref:hypothetical protein n=1 Tax=Deinococcus sp. TaxID=47478 RepID=UPI0025EA3DE1|nr:hypothetical protein [Deinococcus sp.]